jgi:hypothetical protein
MASNLAPGFELIEQSFSQRIEATGEIVFGTLGVFSKGPVNERIRLTSVKQLIDVFGEPDDFSSPYFLNIQKILESRTPVEVVRVEERSVKCSGVSFGAAISGDSGFTSIDSPVDVDAYPLTYDSLFLENDGITQVDLEGFSDTLTFAAVGPGAVYDNVAVSVVNSEDYSKISELKSSLADAITPAEVQAIAETAFTMSLSGSGMTLSLAEELIDPDSSYQVDSQLLDEYLAFENGPEGDDEFAVYEYESGALVSPYLVSSDPKKKDRFAKTMFGPRVVSESSNNLNMFIGKSRLGSKSVTINSFPKTNLTGATELSSSAANLTDELYEQLNENFYNKQDVGFLALVDLDFPLIIKQRMNEICGQRKDAIALLNVASDRIIDLNTEQKKKNQTTLVKNWVDYDLKINSSYSALYANYFKVDDIYNDEERWIPCTGYVASKFALAAKNGNVWDAVSGLGTGVIDGVKKVAFNPDEDQIKSLYPSRVNCIVNFRGEGVIIWGQKTLQSIASATDRINVRQLLIHIARELENFTRGTIFKANNEFTRAEWRANVGAFLREILEAGGIEDYRLVCDDSNNPPEVTSKNEMQAYVLVRPTTIAEFVKVTLADVGGGLTIDEALAGVKR